MKGLILLLGGLLLATQAFAGSRSEIISADVRTDRTGKVSGIAFEYGFYDSSFRFSETRTFCFLGDIQGVCPAIQKYAREMQEQYGQGAHDTVEIQSCRILTPKTNGAIRQFVEARYNLSDDYRGDIDVVREIVPCKAF